MSKEKWINNFPYNVPREQQENVIDFVLDQFEKGKKYAIIECGTGVGKSAIGYTIAKTLKSKASEKETGSYFLTTQKILQEQYYKDFSKKGLVSLSSSSNYSCDKANESCKEVLTQIRAGSDNKKFDSCNYSCKYKKAKKDFIESEEGITNFSYFLTEKNYSKKLPDKSILVIDEAHNLENELTRFIEISVSEYFSNKILKLDFNEEKEKLNTQLRAFNFIKNVYSKKLINKINHIENTIGKLGSNFNLDKFKQLSNQIDMLRSHHKKILHFIDIYDKENWVFDILDENKYKKLVFKPIDISAYSKQYILNYADYVIFMSASIVSHEGFMTTIGLEEDKTVSVKEKSPFPSENRPVIYSPAGSMSAKNIEKTLPVMTQMVKHILDNHKNEKGIIHTHNTKIALHLKNSIGSKRLIVAYGEKREEMLAKHLSSKGNTVLISPSMSEGVDLKGDLSTFQIICKVPFPYLGDKVTRKKMNKWKWWYNTETVRTIIQSLGRSIRCETDVAITYILDSDWNRIKTNCRNYFPEGFFDNYHEY